MGYVWDAFGALTVASAASLLLLTALFIRGRRTHFTVSFGIYTFASGLQKMAGGLSVYMADDAATASFWISAAIWLWFPINAGFLHSVLAYAWRDGRPPWTLVAGVYATGLAGALAAFADEAFLAWLFLPGWYVFCALSLVLFILALVRRGQGRTAIDRTEAHYLAVYLIIGTPFTIEALYLYVAYAAVALWEIAVAYAVATIVMVYGVLRHEIFAIDMYAKRAAFYTTVSVAVAGAFVLLEYVIENSRALAPAAAGPVAALGAALMIAPASHVARRGLAALFPNVEASEDYMTRRKLEVYRAQLEVALADGTFTTNEERVLRRARDRLGVSMGQHRRLEADILGTRLVAPAGARSRPRR